MSNYADSFPSPGETPQEPGDKPADDADVETVRAWGVACKNNREWTKKMRLHVVARSLDRLFIEIGGLSGLRTASPEKTIAFMLGISFLDGSIANRSEILSMFE